MDPTTGDTGETCDHCSKPILWQVITGKYGHTGKFCSDRCATHAWADMAAKKDDDQYEKERKRGWWR